MKRIDAHIHYRPDNIHFDHIAQQAGHANTECSLREAFAVENVEHAVVMGNFERESGEMIYPDYMNYCAGIGKSVLEADKIEKYIALAESHLRRDACVGLKIYAGYTRRDLTDPVYSPFYELAAMYNKPVAVHMGATANPNALLRYSHPLQMDEAAVSFPKVQFVMCHFGNPWLADAAAVLEKNENVAADLSGLLVGKIEVAAYLQIQRGYIEQLKTWIAYVDDYDKFMYGTDWPLANISDYVRLTEYIIPEKYHEKVFYDNARRIYNINK